MKSNPTNNPFEASKRAFERAYANGDYENELQALALAIAYSVINKCIDPQRKRAQVTHEASNAGCNPQMVELKQGIAQGMTSLAELEYCVNNAYWTGYNKEGDEVILADKPIEARLHELAGENLPDGYELVQQAIDALLTVACHYAHKGSNWLDISIDFTMLDKRVYIKTEDSKAYKTISRTPIQLVYNNLRAYISGNKSTRACVNGYSYVKYDDYNRYDYNNDGIPEDIMAYEEAYIRLGRYADIGGYDSNSLYTIETQSLVNIDMIIDHLELNARQTNIIKLRMRGYGERAIATYYGITPQAVQNALKKIQAKAKKIGFEPAK